MVTCVVYLTNVHLLHNLQMTPTVLCAAAYVADREPPLRTYYAETLAYNTRQMHVLHCSTQVVNTKLCNVYNIVCIYDDSYSDNTA